MKERYIIFTSILIILIACKKDEQIGQDLPPLRDEIPFGVLREGTIVFKRVGPDPGNYEGFYVIDVRNERSWSFNPVLGISPVISPDGRKIAFSAFAPYPSDTGYDIHVMDVNGKNKTAVSDFQLGEVFPSWTPDGSKIIYANVSENIDLRYEQYMQSPIKGASDRILIRAFHSLSSATSVSGNSKITFIAISEINDQRLSGIFTMDLSGENLKLLVPWPSNYDLASPVFSRDSKTIAYLSVHRGNNSRYESVNVNLLDTESLDDRVLVKVPAEGEKEWSSASNLTICWSPAGGRLLFTVPEGDFTSHIYLVDLNGTLTKVTSEVGVTDRDVSWSK